MNRLKPHPGTAHRRLLATAAAAILSLSLPLSAQTQATYVYDSSGNRISRITVVPECGPAKGGDDAKGDAATSPWEPAEAEAAAPDTDVSDHAGIKVYPNPFGGDISVDFPSGLAQRPRVSVYTFSGTPVYDGYADTPHAELPLASLKPGVYILVVTAGDMRFSYRIIKE